MFNYFFLDLQIDSIKSSESELAKLNIYALKEIVNNIPIIIIFDRGYLSIELINFLEKNNISYLFRLSSNDYINERKEIKSNDEIIKLMHTYPRMNKIKKNHPYIIEQLKEKKYTETRIIVSKREENTERIFITNLPYKIKADKIETLYLKR